MKVTKILGRVALFALAFSVLPYCVIFDRETKTVEVRSLLWGLRRTPGQEKNNYTFAIPASGLNEKAAAEAEGAPEAPAGDR